MNRKATVTQLHSSMNENEVSRRRRALNKALGGILPQDKLLDALWLWEMKYSDRPAFEISDYLHAVCDTPELKKRQSEIRRNLIRFMSQNLDELGPDPWPLMRDYALTVNSSKAETAPELIDRETPLVDILSSRPALGVMLFVISHWLDAMLNTNPAYAARIRSFMANNLLKAKLRSGAAEMRNWMINESELPNIKMHPDDMRRVVNMIYIGACEYFGPEDADSMLHEAIEEAEELPAAKEFPPKELL
jgi:hypothetical protein